MNLFENKYIIENLATIGSTIFATFLITFLLTPLVGKLARLLKIYDLPAKLRRKSERGISTRIHEYIYPKLGGLAMVCSIFIILLATGNIQLISKGVILGIIIIAITGFLDDKFELNSKLQFLGQFLAASAVVASGISITSLNILGSELSFNWLSGALHIAQFSINFILPADLITIIWIIGLINVINWVGGIDALNGTITSIALITLLLISLSSGNIPLAILISIHLGAVLGVLPFNYPPGKIMYGSIGDFLNGFLLAVFAILGSTKWTATLIILAMPILDGLIVVYMRIKTHPGILKHPLQVLQLSDKNHLHHRLLAAGYSKKTVTLVEAAIMILVCSIALYFSNIRKDALAFILGLSFLFIAFTVVFFLKKRNENKLKREMNIHIKTNPDEPPQKEAVINVVYKEDGEKDNKDEKFIY